MKISLIQVSAQQDRSANVRQAEALMEKAMAEDRPSLLVLPEEFELQGVSGAERVAAAEDAPGGMAYRMAQDFARRHKVFVHAGSILERIPNEDRIYNTSFVFNREGEQVALYRKIHMFDVTAPDGTAYKEFASTRHGEDVVAYDLDGYRIGCAICYDLRFSELFLLLAEKGCDIIVLPAAFTLQTGKDHWEVLCRARAIETQTYFVACDQTGGPIVNGEKRLSYGHSLVCDPWGHTIAKASDGVTHVTARIDRQQIERVRALIPMAQHRRLGVRGACASS